MKKTFLLAALACGAVSAQAQKFDFSGFKFAMNTTFLATDWNTGPTSNCGGLRVSAGVTKQNPAMPWLNIFLGGYTGYEYAYTHDGWDDRHFIPYGADLRLRMGYNHAGLLMCNFGGVAQVGDYNYDFDAYDFMFGFCYSYKKFAAGVTFTSRWNDWYDAGSLFSGLMATYSF